MADTVVVIFIAVAVSAIILQALSMLGIYRSIVQIQQEIANTRADIDRRLDPMAQSLTVLISDSRDSIRTITANAAEVSRTVREQSVRLDNLLSDAVELSRTQLMRLDRTITGILERVDNTTAVVERTIAIPLQEVSALMKGLRTGIDFFKARRRPSSVAEARQDEEMFI
jgi:ABC-type transporter Mla subunit MlaD